MSGKPSGAHGSRAGPRVPALLPGRGRGTAASSARWRRPAAGRTAAPHRPAPSSRRAGSGRRTGSPRRGPPRRSRVARAAASSGGRRCSPDRPPPPVAGRAAGPSDRIPAPAASTSSSPSTSPLGRADPPHPIADHVEPGDRPVLEQLDTSRARSTATSESTIAPRVRRPVAREHEAGPDVVGQGGHQATEPVPVQHLTGSAGPRASPCAAAPRGSARPAPRRGTARRSPRPRVTSTPLASRSASRPRGARSRSAIAARPASNRSRRATPAGTRRSSGPSTERREAGRAARPSRDRSPRAACGQHAGTRRAAPSASGRGSRRCRGPRPTRARHASTTVTSAPRSCRASAL